MREPGTVRIRYRYTVLGSNVPIRSDDGKTKQRSAVVARIFTEQRARCMATSAEKPHLCERRKDGAPASVRKRQKPHTQIRRMGTLAKCARCMATSAEKPHLCERRKDDASVRKRQKPHAQIRRMGTLAKCARCMATSAENPTFAKGAKMGHPRVWDTRAKAPHANTAYGAPRRPAHPILRRASVLRPHASAKRFVARGHRFRLRAISRVIVREV